MTTTLETPRPSSSVHRPADQAPPPVLPPPQRVVAPPGRVPGHDRFLDVLRVGAVLVVVLEHWLMPVLRRSGDELSTGNAFAVTGAWPITWVGQVMPVVFFAAGAVGVLSLHRRRSGTGSRADDGAWVLGRIARIAPPVAVLAAVWIPLPHLLTAAGAPAAAVHSGATVVGQILWFLAVHVGAIALTPLLSRVHARFGGRELLVGVAGAVVVDLLRFGTGADWIGYANVALVWLSIHQVGIAYASGRWHRVPRRVVACSGVVGLALLALAVLAGPYPASMIGMPGDPISNVNPPSAVLLALALVQLSALLLARPAITRWAAHEPVARGLDVLGARAMTIYLWHLPVLVVVGGVVVLGLGLQTPEPFSAAWRGLAGPWVLTLTLALVALVHLVGRWETVSWWGTGGSSRRRRGTAAPARAPLAAALAVTGLLGLTVVGFAPAPTLLDPAGPVPWAGLVLLAGALATSGRTA